jgi:hypothetical protein
MLVLENQDVLWPGLFDYCCRFLLLAASFSPRPTGHGTSHKGFFLSVLWIRIQVFQKWPPLKKAKKCTYYVKVLVTASSAAYIDEKKTSFFQL